MIDFENLDGKSMMNALFMAAAVHTDDQLTPKLIGIFAKYNLSFLDGMAMLFELSAALDKKEGEQDV